MKYLETTYRRKADMRCRNRPAIVGPGDRFGIRPHLFLVSGIGTESRLIDLFVAHTPSLLPLSKRARCAAGCKEMEKRASARPSTFHLGFVGWKEA